MLAGIFVGGKSSRMGGTPKGLLRAPATEEPLVVRLERVLREALLTPVLVGDPTPYRAVLPDVRALADTPGIDGPLAGLSTLLEVAEGPVLAIACDLPFVEVGLLRRLAATDGVVVAPRASAGAPWEALLARYDAPRVVPVLQAALTDGVRSFQKLLARLDVIECVLDANELKQLRDWDSPEDLAR